MRDALNDLKRSADQRALTVQSSAPSNGGGKGKRAKTYDEDAAEEANTRRNERNANKDADLDAIRTPSTHSAIGL